jgi:hypothetical protein
MKFLILNTDYPDFLQWLYARHPDLKNQPYEEQMRVRVRVESLFGVADFYSSNLRKLGHEAYDIRANNEFMQKTWAREHGVGVRESRAVLQHQRQALQRTRRVAAKTPLRYLKPLFRPVLRLLDSQPSWVYEILAAQIKYYKPDIILNQAMGSISNYFLQEMKPYVRLVVGQHAATPLSDSEDWGCYDLAVSSFPPTVDWFRRKGIDAELNRLGFEPRVLSCLKDKGRNIEISFLGSLSNIHGSRVVLLERLCARLDVKIWGPGINHLGPGSSIRKSYNGPAWGRDMYQIMRSSKITLNHHGDIAPYANNMRLYEATGVGTLLITDWRKNLHEMFEPGKEVVVYRTPEECGELIRYYLEHEDEREAIACAGQERVLKEHTYHQRMQELVNILKRYR